MLFMQVVFSMGVLLQAILILRSVMDFSSGLLSFSKAFGVSLLAFLPITSEQHYDFYSHYNGAIMFFMCAFSAMNNKKILPIISERYLILVNMIFLYYVFGGVVSLVSRMDTVDAIFVAEAIFLPTIAVLVNGLVPIRIPEWVKGCFYLWYLFMASVLLFIVMLPTYFVVMQQEHMTYLFWFNLFSLGMLTLSLSVDVVNTLLIVPIPGRHQTFAERWANVKMHFKLLSSKYEDDDLEPIKTLILVVVVPLIFVSNTYFLHLNDFLVTSVVFIAGRMILSGYQSQAGDLKNPVI
ncbi:MAG: hypothetical protein SFW07_00775 [Gammaproteobacteria bacterium]|nr:hypothetical protein [Gammaproteobacteria bacterium]